MSRRPFLTFLVGALAGIGAVVGIVIVGLRFGLSDVESHRGQVMRQLHSTIDIGETYADVLDAYWKSSSPFLLLDASRHDTWAVIPPHAFFGELELWLQFKDEKVSGVAIVETYGLTPSGFPTPKGTIRVP